MELTALSSRYGNFFAPAFSLKIGGDDLTRDLLLAVAQVEVDLVLGAASVLVISLSIWQGVQLWPRLLEYPMFRQVAHLTVLLN